MSLNILIVDDDAPARRRMRQLLARCPPDHCGDVEEAADAVRAAGLMRHRRFDLVLLDIHMPGQTGLQLAHSMRGLPQQPSVVFVTGHTQHALHAFDVDAIDYITKPVHPDRLARALAKASDRHRPDSGDVFSENNSLRIVQRGQAQRVRLADVLYIRAENKRLTLFTHHGMFETDGTLAELEDLFDHRVLRVHRHTLAVMSAVTQLRRVDNDLSGNPKWMLGLRGGCEPLPVARRMVSAVRDRLLFRKA